MCSRHRTLSTGRCPLCVNDKTKRQQLHTHKRGREFRLAILERDGFVCQWCGGEATQLDYVRALADGGEPFDATNAVAACQRCAPSRGSAVPHRGNFRGEIRGGDERGKI